jgi:hypothetical protein
VSSRLTHTPLQQHSEAQGSHGSDANPSPTAAKHQRAAHRRLSTLLLPANAAARYFSATALA